MAQELRNMTSNPETLSSEDIADASVALENLTQSAIDNENVRKRTHDNIYKIYCAHDLSACLRLYMSLL